MERTRDEVVRILHERGERSVAELAEEIGVSSGSIRRHMDLMVADGLVVSHLERQPRGRPITRYALSEAGEERTSASHYQKLLARLSPALATLSAEDVAGQDGRAVLDRLFDRVAESVAQEHAGQIRGVSIDARVHEVTVALSAEGILQEVEDAGDYFRLRNTGCPYRTTASETHACCAADRRAIELLLGSPVEQITTVAGGGHACEYLVAKDDDERPALASGLLPVVEQKGTASAR
jgi:predicted ArsR family transcriptional regulator